MDKLSLRQLIRAKSPSLESSLPDFVVGALEKWLCIDRVGELLDMGQGMRPLEFVDALLGRLSISYEAMWEMIPSSGRCLFASNHPFGGIDGIMLAHCVGRRFGDVRVGVNDLLMALRPLRPIFMPVNKHGRQSHDSVEEFDRAFRGDCPIVTFPAGLCSRRSGGRVRDTAWNTGFVKRAVVAQRDVVPVYVEGRLSERFYRLAWLRKSLGIKQNIEMLCLPSELFAQQGEHFRIVFGSPIAWEILALERSPRKQTELVREEMERLRHYC